jgi:hypothetical protein
MPSSQLQHATIISFDPRGTARPHPPRSPGLTSFDRIEITRWRDQARSAGYDRMVIHERDSGDAQDVDNFLSVYRSGESWSRWGFVRMGEVVRAWCCLSGADVGEFASLAEALRTVLLGSPRLQPSRATVVKLHRASSAVVTNLQDARFARRMGSAA